MTTSSNSYLLTNRSPIEVEEYLTRDRRLLIPVGVCDQYGPHLPIGSSSVVAEEIAATLAREFGILQAPTIPLGVNLPADTPRAGTSGMREKTLHTLMNDVLASWEDSGFAEFILITAHDYDPHVEALASVSGTRARVRVIEVLGIDLSEFVESPPGPEHGGEVLTSLMLHLRPEQVNKTQLRDFELQPEEDDPRRLDRLPPESPGLVGQPSLASAAKGERIFNHIVDRIRTKVIIDPSTADD